MSHAVSVAENQRGEVRLSAVAPALATGGGKIGMGYSAVLAPAATGLSNRGRHTGDVTETLRSDSHGAVPMVAANDEAEEPYTIDWQQGVAKENDRAWVVDKPGRTRALTANRTLAVFGGNNTSGERDIAAALTAHPGRYDFETESLVVAGALRASQGGADDNRAQASHLVVSDAISIRTAQTSSNGWGIKDGVTGTLDETGGGAVLAPTYSFTERGREGGRTVEAREEIMSALTNPGEGGRSTSRQIAAPSGVRRLTPVECERLQGFPDGWTDGQSDSHRYRQMGNAICVLVMWWIGARIVRAHEEA